MFSPATLAMATAMLAAPALLTAAVTDVAARIIPNPIPLTLAAIGGLARLYDGTPGMALLAAGLVFLLTVCAWRAEALGGGDVKLLAACALLVPPSLVPAMVTDVALAGLVLSLCFLAARGRISLATASPQNWLGRVGRIERWRMRRGGPLPYAVAIGAGVLTALAMEAV